MVDGGQHADQQQDDARRTGWLEDQGFVVLRFWNHEVLAEPEAVIQAIADALAPPTRPSCGGSTSPARGEVT